MLFTTLYSALKDGQKTHVAMVTLPQHAARGSPLVTVATAAQRLSAEASGGGTTTLPAELNHRRRRQDKRTRPVCGNESKFRIRSGSGPEARGGHRLS